MDEVHKKKRINKSHQYKETFSTESGKKVLLDLMRTHYIASLSYSKEPMDMAFNEGQRSVVLRILKFVKEDVSKIEKYMEDIERGMYE
jgi:hypothetical protein